MLYYYLSLSVTVGLLHFKSTKDNCDPSRFLSNLVRSEYLESIMQCYMQCYRVLVRSEYLESIMQCYMQCYRVLGEVRVLSIVASYTKISAPWTSEVI